MDGVNGKRPRYPNTEEWVEKTRRSRVFSTNFEVFGYLMKQSCDYLVYFLKVREIQSKSSPNVINDFEKHVDQSAPSLVDFPLLLLNQLLNNHAPC